MKIKTVTVLCMLLVALSVRAGTFRDDFEDGNLDGWRQANPATPMLWKIVDGELECTRLDATSTVFVVGEDSWTDYTIEYEVMLLEDHGTGDVDVMARYIDPVWTHVILFAIGDYLGASAIFAQRFPGNVVEQEPFEPLELNVWHRLKLEAEGDNFTFWLNNEKIMDYRDAMVETGSIGLGLANYTARFDNVEISGPEVPDVTPSTWKSQSVQPGGNLVATWGSIK